MAAVVYSQAAIFDLDGIFDYVARDNLTAADRLIDLIADRATCHAESPLLGNPCFEFAKELRNFTVGNYVVFYLPVLDGIQLIRVLHSARDIPAIFDQGRVK